MHAGTESVEAERPKERQKRREEKIGDLDRKEECRYSYTILTYNSFMNPDTFLYLFSLDVLILLN